MTSTERQTDRQSNRQTDRDRQTETDTQTEIERERERQNRLKTLTCDASKYKIHKLHQRYILKDVPLVEAIYLAFTRMPRQSLITIGH